MRFFDFSSWQGILTSLLGLALFTLIGMGIRVLMMLTIQQRQQRANRQINERLKTLMAAYKVLGGSFTGNLLVDPTHLRDLRRAIAEAGDAEAEAEEAEASATGSERARRTRDAVEAALSDIILLGTEEQVRLAATAAADMVAGKPIETAALVVSLRDFIRSALGLDPVPAAVVIPNQGPTRQQAARSGRPGAEGAARGVGGGAGGAGGAMAGGGMGMGMGLGMGARRREDDLPSS